MVSLRFIGLNKEKSEKEEIRNCCQIINREIEKIAKSITNIQEAAVHFKEYKAKKEGKVKYDLHLKLSLSGKIISVSQSGWNLIVVTKALLERLKSSLKKHFKI